MRYALEPGNSSPRLIGHPPAGTTPTPAHTTLRPLLVHRGTVAHPPSLEEHSPRLIGHPLADRESKPPHNAPMPYLTANHSLYNRSVLAEMRDAQPEQERASVSHRKLPRTKNPGMQFHNF